MKLTSEPGARAAAVKFAAQALPARPLAPILAGLKITSADRGMQVCGFDYETSARSWAAAVGEPGTVPTDCWPTSPLGTQATNRTGRR